jgi:cytidine deaminase
MKDKLIKLLDNSYSPYSNYKVSCIVVMKDGKEFNGVNVENASYGATLCAERTAIFSAIANGYKRYDFKELYVMNATHKIGSSCFICRQVISELFEKNCKCIFMNIDGKEEIHTVEEICPFPFDDDNLK